jgi:hypothetical protein
MKYVTKGDLMDLIFTAAELRNIDVALPKGAVSADDTYFYVMDYNDESVFGRLVDMREEAATRGIKLPVK